MPDEKALEAEKAKAANIGIGKGLQKLTADWGRKLTAYFELHKRYPENKNKSTTAKVSLVLSRLGKAVSVGVAETSGDAAFDDAAVSMSRRSHPGPPPPAARTDTRFGSA